MKQNSPGFHQEFRRGQALCLISLCMILIVGQANVSEYLVPHQSNDSASLLILPSSLFSGADFNAAATSGQDAEGVPQNSAAEISPLSVARRRDDWLVGGFDTSGRWLTAGLALGRGVYLGSADMRDVRDLGDLTQLLPGAFALTGNLIIGDREGLKRFGLTVGGSLAVFDSVLELNSGDTTAKSGATTVRPTVTVRFKAAPADRWLFFCCLQYLERLRSVVSVFHGPGCPWGLVFMVKISCLWQVSVQA